MRVHGEDTRSTLRQPDEETEHEMSKNGEKLCKKIYIPYILWTYLFDLSVWQCLIFVQVCIY